MWLWTIGAILGSLICLSQVDAQNCRKVKANVQGTTQQDIQISSTPVTVLMANTARCAAIIYNNSPNDIRCSDVTNDAPPTASSGFVVGGWKWLGMDLEGQGQWQCIRAGANDAIVSVVEGLP